VAGATNNTVWYGTTDGGPYPTKRTATAGPMTVTGLTNGTPYYFVVTASDANGPSAISAQVTATPYIAPVISSFGALSNGSFTLGGTGAASQTYVLLTTSNLFLPIVWTPIATNTADTQGAFSFADLQSTNYQQRFYRIWAP
jgi:cellulose 1,4-beta-cellobiosidase